MTSKTAIIAEKAPAALGPYSAAIRVGDGRRTWRIAL